MYTKTEPLYWVLCVLCLLSCDRSAMTENNRQHSQDQEPATLHDGEDFGVDQGGDATFNVDPLDMNSANGGRVDFGSDLGSQQIDEGMDEGVITTCDPVMRVEPTPSGPRPESQHRAPGVDRWEYSAYQSLRVSLADHPEVHFIASKDMTTGDFLIDGGDPGSRVQVRFRRVDIFSGSTFEVIEGDLSEIFPNTDQRVFGDLEALYAAYDHSDALFYPDVGYEEGDPRLGLIPRPAQVYPSALERIGTLFSAPHAPDVIYGLWPGSHSSRGSHGGLGLLQSRATLMLGGAGVRAHQLIERSAGLPDVLPTVLAALGAGTTGGVGRDGVYDDGLYLLKQDGRVLWEALSEDPCDRPTHVVIILFDGLLATEINHQIHSSTPDVDLPFMRATLEDGSAYIYGATAGFPTVSAAGHTTSGTGLWPGHSGVVSNSYFDRERQSVITPFAILDDVQGFLQDRERLDALIDRMFAPDVETVAEAAHRAFGRWDGVQGAFVAVINEILIRDADFSTPDFFGVNSPKSLETYQLADTFAILQINRLLNDLTKPVPTILQTSFFTTDDAGEIDGPHSDLLRETLVDLDAKVGEIRAAYERRGAIEDTMFIMISDHGMELQDVAQATGIRPFLNGSGVQTSFIGSGLLYLRSLELKVEVLDQALILQVVNHDDEHPVSGSLVRCEGCLESDVLTDEEGYARLSIDPERASERTVLMVTADGFNPQRWER